MSDTLQIGRQALTLSPGTSAAQGRPSASAIQSSVDMIELCNRQLFVTAGTSYVYSYVGPVLADVGPNISEIVAHYGGQSFGTGFDFTITAEWSPDGQGWINFSGPIATGITAATSAISTPTTTRTDFGRYIRFRVGVKDGGTVTSGTVSVMVALRRYT